MNFSTQLRTSKLRSRPSCFSNQLILDFEEELHQQVVYPSLETFLSEPLRLVNASKKNITRYSPFAIIY